MKSDGYSGACKVSRYGCTSIHVAQLHASVALALASKSGLTPSATENDGSKVSLSNSFLYLPGAVFKIQVSSTLLVLPRQVMWCLISGFTVVLPKGPE